MTTYFFCYKCSQACIESFLKGFKQDLDTSEPLGDDYKCPVCLSFMEPCSNIFRSKRDFKTFYHRTFPQKDILEEYNNYETQPES